MNINTYFSDQQKRRSLLILSAFHIFILALSNYLVQIAFEVKIPFTDIAFHTTWGTLSFPFIFLSTDLTVRVFGADLARRIIFLVMFPALLVSYVMSVIFFEGNFQGFGALATFNLFVFRIALASFLAYAVGQIMDILVFNRLRQTSTWWLAPTSSTLFGSLIDTFVFFFVAFYQGDDAFMAANWFEIGVVDYLFKISVSLSLFVPLYGVLLNYLVRKLNLTVQK